MRNPYGSDYKSPPETLQGSPQTPTSLTLNRLQTSLAMVCTLRVPAIPTSNRPPCYQQTSFVLVNQANCANCTGCSANCSCAEKCVARRCVRYLGHTLTRHSTAARARPVNASAKRIHPSAWRMNCPLFCTTTFKCPVTV